MEIYFFCVCVKTDYYSSNFIIRVPSEFEDDISPYFEFDVFGVGKKNTLVLQLIFLHLFI